MKALQQTPSTEAVAGAMRTGSTASHRSQTSGRSRPVLSSKGKAKDALVGTPTSGWVANDNPAPEWQAYVKAYQDAFPADKRLPSPSLFGVGYHVNTLAMIAGLNEVKGDLSDGQKKFREAEAIIPYREQNHREHFHQGEPIRAVLKRVEETPKGPRLILTRAGVEFVQALFRLEVPGAKAMTLSAFTSPWMKASLAQPDFTAECLQARNRGVEAATTEFVVPRSMPTTRRPSGPRPDHPPR